MKHPTFNLFTLLCAFIMAFIIVPLACAAAIDPASTITADPTTAIPEEAQNAVLQFFLHLAALHPWFATALVLAGLSRTWAKPFCSVLHFVVDLTPSKNDDGILNAVMTWFSDNAVGQFVAYMVDWLTSIKIVPPKA